MPSWRDIKVTTLSTLSQKHEGPLLNGLRHASRRAIVLALEMEYVVRRRIANGRYETAKHLL